MTITLFLLAFCASLPIILLCAFVAHVTITPVAFTSTCLEEFWGLDDDCEIEMIENRLEDLFFNPTCRNTRDMDCKVRVPKKVYGWTVDRYCSIRDSLLDQGVYALTFEDIMEENDEDGPVPVEVGFWITKDGMNIYHTWV